MLLTELLDERRIKVPLTASTRDSVIAELLDVLVASGDVTDRDKVLQAILQREQTHTTGIGSGIALPHGKTAAITHLAMAMGRTAQPIDFASVDGKPVMLVFLLVSPMDKTGPHIQALAHISRLVVGDAFRAKLAAAQSADEILAAIKQQEKE